MKLLLENWNSFLNEAHGLSQQDLDYLKNFTEKTNDVEIKRILKIKADPCSNQYTKN